VTVIGATTLPLSEKCVKDVLWYLGLFVVSLLGALEQRSAEPEGTLPVNHTPPIKFVKAYKIIISFRKHNRNNILATGTFTNGANSRRKSCAPLFSGAHHLANISIYSNNNFMHIFI